MEARFGLRQTTGGVFYAMPKVESSESGRLTKEKRIARTNAQCPLKARLTILLMAASKPLRLETQEL
jgi:hypothetical protein